MAMHVFEEFAASLKKHWPWLPACAVIGFVIGMAGAMYEQQQTDPQPVTVTVTPKTVLKTVTRKPTATVWTERPKVNTDYQERQNTSPVPVQTREEAPQRKPTPTERLTERPPARQTEPPQQPTPSRTTQPSPKPEPPTSTAEPTVEPTQETSHDDEDLPMPTSSPVPSGT